jgi:hypothetical protein
LKAKAKPKDAKPSAATVKLLEQLAEVAKEITRLEALRKQRLDLIQEAAKAGATTKAISDASSLSVPRLRQLITK